MTNCDSKAKLLKPKFLRNKGKITTLVQPPVPTDHGLSVEIVLFSFAGRCSVLKLVVCSLLHFSVLIVDSYTAAGGVVFCSVLKRLNSKLVFALKNSSWNIRQKVKAILSLTFKA